MNFLEAIFRWVGGGGEGYEGVPARVWAHWRARRPEAQERSTSTKELRALPRPSSVLGWAKRGTLAAEVDLKPPHPPPVAAGCLATATPMPTMTASVGRR